MGVKGRFLPFSAPRRMIGDLLTISQAMPLVPGERTMQLAPVVAARQATLPRPSWLAMFVKALALVSEANPIMRQVYVRRPWQRLFQYDETVVSVVVERDCGGEPGLFLARIKSPQKMSLAEIDAQIRKYKERPIAELPAFQNALRLVRLPLILRRGFWSLVMNWMPRLRGKLLGTCGISLTAGMGGIALSLLTPWTTTLFYDALGDDGSLTTRMMIDHRVLDGRATCLIGREIEKQLRGPILQELQELAAARSARSAA